MPHLSRLCTESARRSETINWADGHIVPTLGLKEGSGEFGVATRKRWQELTVVVLIIVPLVMVIWLPMQYLETLRVPGEE